MKYLTIDGMFSGTGICDSVEGGYISLDQFDVSDSLKTRFSSWLNSYEDEHYEGYSNKNKIKELDQEGIELCKCLLAQLPDTKIEYYSSGETKKLPFKI